MAYLDLGKIYGQVAALKAAQQDQDRQAMQMQQMQEQQARQGQLRDLITNYAQQVPGEQGPETPWAGAGRMGDLLSQAAAIEPQYLPQAYQAQQQAAQQERDYRLGQEQKAALMGAAEHVPEMSKFKEVMSTLPPDQAMQFFNKMTPQAKSESAYWTPVQTSTGVFKFNARTGELIPAEGTGGQLMPVSIDPRAQAAVESAKVTAKGLAEIGLAPKKAEAEARAKKSSTMLGVDSILEEARSLLQGQVDPSTGQVVMPTGSGAGEMVDAAGRFIGQTSGGAKLAARLEVIGGNLVGKVPRFEGPQSDADVRYYKAMAGKIGDRSVPVGERQAALESVTNMLKAGVGPSGSVIAGGQKNQSHPVNPGESFNFNGITIKRLK
jgi:hypothetical protein